MKLNVGNVSQFMEVIHKCQGNVYLVDAGGGNDIRINLKSELSLFIGVSKLLGEHGDWFELYADRKDDEQLLLSFMFRNDQ